MQSQAVTDSSKVTLVAKQIGFFQEDKPTKKATDNNIVYLSLDLNFYISGKEYKPGIVKYLNMPLKEKMTYIKNKIIEAYALLKQHHPDSPIFILMREGAIGPQTNSGHLSQSIVTEAEKDYIIDELKHFTLDRDLIIVPGSIVYAVENVESQSTIVYNRAYVLQQNAVVGFQGKANFSNIDLDKTTFKNPKQANDEINHIINIKINAHSTLKMLIDICLDHEENKGTEQVDLHLLLSNSTCFQHKRLRGKLYIHSDSAVPTTFSCQDRHNSPVIYTTPLVMSDLSLYSLNQMQVDKLINRLDDNDPFSPPEIFCNRRILYGYEEIYDIKNKISPLAAKISEPETVPVETINSEKNEVERPSFWQKSPKGQSEFMNTENEMREIFIV